jgi:site-specific DNA recombinase
VDDLRESERQLANALAAKKSIEGEQPPVCELPPIAELKRIARESLLSAYVSHPDLSALMRSLIPEIRVFPVRLCDGGLITLRAKFVLSLVPFLRVDQRTESVQRCLSIEMQVDLFDLPQRARFRSQVISMRQAGMTESVIASTLGITKTATQDAAALNRKMIQLGLAEPYVAVQSPPDDYGKLRRHRHSRFRFRRVGSGGENTAA